MSHAVSCKLGRPRCVGHRGRPFLGVHCGVSGSILQRVANGDAAAMPDCLETYGGLVWSIARRFLGRAEDAHDAVQEVFIAVWESAGRFNPELGSESTFVAMIARRKLIDRLRKRTREARLGDELRAEATVGAEEVSTTADPAIKDDADKARQAMEELSEGQQRVLRLAINHGLTHEQIATHTGLPLGTVKTHARRGLMRVRELLQDAETSSAADGGAR